MLQRKIPTLSMALVLIWLWGCSGAESLGGGGIRETANPGNTLPPGSPVGLPPAAGAAGPTQEGILSAPADDDSIETGTDKEGGKLMHFDVMLPTEYKVRLGKQQALLGADKLTFLAQVGETLKDGCEDMDDLSCWNWLDPNLLKGLVVRAKVVTVAREGSPDNSVPTLLTKLQWYYQDFKIGELNSQGYNLSLLDLKPMKGDEVWLTMYNQVPEDYSPTRSEMFDGIPSDYSGKGRHWLGVVKIGEIFYYRP